MKPANIKVTSQRQLKRAEVLTFTQPTATKIQSTKKLKEVTAIKLKNSLHPQKVTFSHRSHAATTNNVIKLVAN